MNWESTSIAHASQSTASRFTVSRLTASRLTTFGSIASRSIASRSTASKYSSNLDQSWPPTLSPNTLNYGFQLHLWVHSISASLHLQTRSITACKFIPELTQSLGLQVHLQTCSIPASKCISEFNRSQSPSASPNTLHHSLQVHLQGVMAVVWRYRGNRGGQSDVEYIFGRPQSTKTSSHFHLLLSYNENKHSLFSNFWSHSLCPRFRGSTQLRRSSTPGSIISSYLIPTVLEPKPLFLMNSVWMSREVRQRVDGGLLCHLAPSFHHNGLQVVHLYVLSMGMSRCSSNYARAPTAARLAVWIYIEKLR